MSKAKYLAFDTETGGLNPEKNPVLTAYFAIIGEDFGTLDELQLFIKPEAPFDFVDQEALSVNKIELSKHISRPDAVTRDQAKIMLIDFLKKNKPKGSKVRPLGHNVDFDINMLKSQILPINEWESLIHYAKMDTKISSDFLKEAGWLPPEIGTLESLVRHFGIVQLGAHDAKNDTIMMVEVYRKLIDTLAGKKGSNENSIDVLSLLEK